MHQTKSKKIAPASSTKENKQSTAKNNAMIDCHSKFPVVNNAMIDHNNKFIVSYV